VQEYKNKLEGLAKEEQRLQMVQDMLKKDIENLNDLRVKLASMVVRLKDERDKLLKSRVEIARAEKENLQSIATAYDKMDSTAAGKILTNMCASDDGGSKRRVIGGAGSNMDDAVKILYYMAEKTKAKVLAELVNSEPGLAALLCERLKRVTEQG
jgi:flagellar motility protein MotE (MotC chaperone)